MLYSAPVPVSTHNRNDAPLWLQRASLTTLVVTCIYLGLMIVILPWTHYWQENRLVGYLPERIAAWSQTGWARGLVSGLGLLDIWIGISELLEWRRRHRKPVNINHNGALRDERS